MKTKFDYIVFFDVDETIINVKSMFSFLQFFYQQEKQSKLLGNIKYYVAYYRLKAFAKLGKSREFINSEYYKLYRGKKSAIIKSYGEKWLLEKSMANNQFYHQQVLDELHWHKSNKACIVLVSGSFEACLNPIVDHVGADYILATTLEVNDGIYTGKILPPQTIGHGKVEAIKLFLDKIGFYDVDKCYAYADHISDLQMLTLVGNPVVVANCKKLEVIANAKGWRILQI